MFTVLAGTAAWIRHDVPPARVSAQFETASDRAEYFHTLLSRRRTWVRRRRMRSSILRWDQLNRNEDE